MYIYIYIYYTPGLIKRPILTEFVPLERHELVIDAAVRRAGCTESCRAVRRFLLEMVPRNSFLESLIRILISGNAVLQNV